MNTFSFSLPQNIKFGRGSLDELSKIAETMKVKKAFIVSGPHLFKAGLVSKCAESLGKAGIRSESFTETEGNPSVETVNKATEYFKKSNADIIVAFGGGSPIDVAKAVAILGKYGGEITDYEGVGKVPGPVIPMIAIPTTAGTGSEVTLFAVIGDDEGKKKPFASTKFLPEVILLDAAMTISVPKGTTAFSGIDALSHIIEAAVSQYASTFREDLQAAPEAQGNIQAP